MGLIYITYSSLNEQSDRVALRAAVPPSKEIERWGTFERHARLQHDDKESLFNKRRQMKRVTFSTEHKSPEGLVRKEDEPHDQAIRSNRIIPLQSETTVRQQSTSRQLFVSDEPIVVKDFMSWKEAGKTNTLDEEEQSKDGFTRHAFNQYASDRLGYFRDIPDTRHTL